MSKSRAIDKWKNPQLPDRFEPYPIHYAPYLKELSGYEITVFMFLSNLTRPGAMPRVKKTTLAKRTGINYSSLCKVINSLKTKGFIEVIDKTRYDLTIGYSKLKAEYEADANKITVDNFKEALEEEDDRDSEEILYGDAHPHWVPFPNVPDMSHIADIPFKKKASERDPVHDKILPTSLADWDAFTSKKY